MPAVCYFSVFYNIKCLCTIILQVKISQPYFTYFTYIQGIISLSKIFSLSKAKGCKIVKNIFKLLYCHEMTLGKALTGSFIGVSFEYWKSLR